ncbi:MAG: DegT/DnrJ/EryC1/StrS family aminotransferase [Zoogloeaceae bacterium]|jgi:dTDP-4-amino-4,6-dideoxygalactose transaminase|nr:DegT/DnrJ/EryC1/StrS family aminotransferase [Zoogloeaceae bacterium]
MTDSCRDIFVTKPSLPPLEEFIPSLEAIWESAVLTNGGLFHQRFEAALAEYLGAKHLCLFVNGTIALLTALQALRVTGEVLTTPFSFVATSHALWWNGVKPVFVDIDASMNMNPERLEAAITPRTTAILAVHCYGRPCDVRAIQDIAGRHNLKVIYDAAHAFGVRDEGGSVLRHGDLSVLSFHATKVFNTFEGGAIICPDEKTKQHIDDLKNFGHADEVTVVAPGINGKMNEFCAALGLLQLKHIDAALARRAGVDARYRERLKTARGIQCLERAAGKSGNYAYFPILVREDYPIARDELYWRLKKEGIHPRRYFYPLISEFPMYRGLDSARSDNLPVAARLSRQVLCLPIYPDLEMSVVDAVCDLIAAP